MQSGITRFTQVGDWIFEVKMVRALRVEKYGQPYDAVSTLTANGDNLYIDTQLTRQHNELSREDCMSFYEFARQLEMKQIQYDKLRNGERQSRIVEIVENQRPRAKVHLARVK
ncbi:hypothetical protein [Marisediminitalea sp.]|uniref:hypothetical protein n=1 Tax=Marisediminitalea sp. TaxID=2662268 RepID=UPI003511D172